ncbi:serine hydrolase FSH [Microdochium trichocladiopsis]|uniref:Serine hydrolase FSH n=1 Tax=Microdochium trichocladiopsis TaxID=1682393 RepID=A0A9P8XVF7_9PEZI|nr:serine hydrolase FSH [Microdochium trichocladiopsis]KAH7018066.1 serine hydrolase FSH [Microdochium trichocladiopsis]
MTRDTTNPAALPRATTTTTTHAPAQQPPRPTSTNPLSKPRILCLHGGGTNARIFKAQCRVLSRVLDPWFRLVYAEAPFESQPGPDVLSVYADCGPFKRWLRWKPEHAAITDEDVVAAIDEALAEAMSEDDDAGATGEWVGLLGFSQGAKLAASLMFRQQVLLASPGGLAQGRDNNKNSTGTSIRPLLSPVEWKFAILHAGRAPLVNLLGEATFSSSLLSRPSQIGLADKPDDSGHHVPHDIMDVASGKHMLDLPTVHVHGLQDVGIHLHRDLLDTYCTPGSAVLVEWDGAHRMPLKAGDVQLVVDAMLAVAAETGAI